MFGSDRVGGPDEQGPGDPNRPASRGRVLGAGASLGRPSRSDAHAGDCPCDGGKTRAEAARLVGLERQALRDAVTRYNAEGVAGLSDRPKAGRPPTLTDGEQATLRAMILRGAEPERDGGGEWTVPMLCRWIEGNFGKRLHPASLSRVVRRRTPSSASGPIYASGSSRIGCSPDITPTSIPAAQPGTAFAPNGSVPSPLSPGSHRSLHRQDGISRSRGPAPAGAAAPAA